MEEGVRPYARPISCNDCPAFQRRQMSVRCAADTSARFPCVINTTLDENLFSVNYPFLSCCLICKCYRRIGGISCPILDLVGGVKSSRPARDLCSILRLVGEAEAGSVGEQPAKE